MGYHTNVIAVRGRKLADLERALPDEYSPPYEDSEALSYDDAAAGSLEPDCAAAEIRGWLVVWDPIGQLAFGPHGEEFRAKLFANTDAVAVGLEGTTDTYWFQHYAGGELTRSIRYTQRSEVEESTGEPHPAEANIKLPKWGRDEDWGFTLLERISKITRKQLDEASYFRVLFG